MDPHIAALVEIVERLEAEQRQLRSDHKALAEQVTAGTELESRAHSEPGPWVWFTPPAAAEDDPDAGLDPRFTIDNFVAWHNITFVGVDGGRGRPIPVCWPQHTGLAMEVATLAYTWREANIGVNANARDAQQWLHQWRPSFIDRMQRDWIHPDCLDGHHRATAGQGRQDRHTLNSDTEGSDAGQ